MYSSSSVCASLSSTSFTATSADDETTSDHPAAAAPSLHLTSTSSVVPRSDGASTISPVASPTRDDSTADSSSITWSRAHAATFGSSIDRLAETTQSAVGWRLNARTHDHAPASTAGSVPLSCWTQRPSADSDTAASSPMLTSSCASTDKATRCTTGGAASSSAAAASSPAASSPAASAAGASAAASPPPSASPSAPSPLSAAFFAFTAVRNASIS